MDKFINAFLTYVPPWLIIALIAHGTVMLTVAYLILLERKVAAWAQDRLGPNRVGPGGLLQPIADGLKMLLKEDYRPADTDSRLFTIAPAVMMLVMVVSIAVLPLGGVKQTTRLVPTYDLPLQQAAEKAAPYGATVISVKAAPQVDRAIVTYRYPFQIANLNIGVLFILAVLSIAVYGIVVGGWASNNKYSFLGGLRATANMISYEVPLGLSILTIVVMYGTLNLNDIVTAQAHYWFGFIPAWNIFTQPLAFIMFLTCIHAEANRAPFDIAEAEQELVGGYHTEYSAMRFGMFYLAEYAGMLTTSALCVALFFGGWHLPWLEWLWPALQGNVDKLHPAISTSLAACIVRAIVFFIKTIMVVFIFMWVRWSLPRFRFDQIMQLAWRAMIPISLVVLIATAFTLYFYGPHDAGFRETGLINWQMAVTLLIVNIVVLVVVMFASLLVPAAPPTNRRVRVLNSRYDNARHLSPASSTTAG